MINAQQLRFIQEDEKSKITLLERPRELKSFSSEQYAPFQSDATRSFVARNLSPDRGYDTRPIPEDLVAGKNTHVYDAHTYHTKVPPEAIKASISHFTEPGDLVLDPFCGSGMTGVAAIATGRKPILSDLSPAATFIAFNFVTPISHHEYFTAVREILRAAEDEEKRLYGTHCRTCGKLVPMEYMVWSYGLTCKECGKEFILWDVARDEKKDVRKSKIRTEFNCPHCKKHLEKKRLHRTKLYPVQVGYRCCDSGLQESKADPDAYDLSLLDEIASAELPTELYYPRQELPPGVNTRQPISHGLTSVDKLYTRRNLWAVARLWNIAGRWPDADISAKLLFTVTSLYQRVTRLSEFRFWGGSGNIANYNVPMIFNEQNVFKVFYRKSTTIRNYLETWSSKPDTPFYITTQSATDLGTIPDKSIDYIFTDPPFGGNINYSEMNFVWESWLQAFTDPTNEAIINRVQGKDTGDYSNLMAQALREMYRVLKPGRWLTLVFHNSSSDVWGAIQQALLTSGFRIEGTQTLDKRHGTFKQFVSDNAVGYDLVIHCHKDQNGLGGHALVADQSGSYLAVEHFVRQVLQDKPDEFLIHYLHVNRGDELDTRRLYSMWLEERIRSHEIIDLDYEKFRNIALSALEGQPKTKPEVSPKRKHTKHKEENPGNEAT